MMVEKLVEALGQMNERIERMEAASEQSSKAMNTLLEFIGSPSGFVTFSGTTKTRTEDLLNAFRDSARFNLEFAEIDVRFSQAIYMSLDPKHKDELEELLSEAQLTYLKTMLEQRKRLDDIIGESERQVRQAAEIAKQASETVRVNIKSQVSHAHRKVLERVQENLRTMERQKTQVEKALNQINSALEKTEALQARAGNIIKTKGEISRTPFSLKK